MLTPVVLADASHTIEFADHSEVGARFIHQTLTPATLASAPGAQSDSAFVDLTTRPQVGARVYGRRGAFTLVYAPSLTLTLPQTDQTTPVYVMHTGSANMAWHDRLVRADLVEDWSYGQTNQPASAPPPGQAPPVQGMPSAGQPMQPSTTQQAAVQTTITTLASRTAGTMLLQTGRFSSLSMTVAYSLSGGLDGGSQQVIPQQKGPRAEASLRYNASRRTQFVTGAYAQRSEFTEELCFNPLTQMLDQGTTCAPQADVVQGAEEVRYALDRTTTLSASLGGTFARTRVKPSDLYYAAVFPNAAVSAGHTYGAGGRGRLAVQAQLAPVVDFRSGLVSNRLTGSVSMALPASRRVTVRASVSGSQTVPLDDPVALTLLGGNVDAEAAVSRRATLFVGARGQWQTQAPFGPFFYSYLYFGVTAGAPALRF